MAESSLARNRSGQHVHARLDLRNAEHLLNDSVRRGEEPRDLHKPNLLFQFGNLDRRRPIGVASAVLLIGVGCDELPQLHGQLALVLVLVRLADVVVAMRLAPLGHQRSDDRAGPQVLELVRHVPALPAIGEAFHRPPDTLKVRRIEPAAHGFALALSHQWHDHINCSSRV